MKCYIANQWNSSRSRFYKQSRLPLPRKNLRNARKCKREWESILGGRHTETQKPPLAAVRPVPTYGALMRRRFMSQRRGWNSIAVGARISAGELALLEAEELWCPLLISTINPTPHPFCLSFSLFLDISPTSHHPSYSPSFSLSLALFVQLCHA